MRKLIPSLLIVFFASSVQAGLIVKETAGTVVAPGATASFDLILRNQTLGTTDAIWAGINAVGPIKFQDPLPTLAGQTAPTFAPAVGRGFTPDAFWNLSFFDDVAPTNNEEWSLGVFPSSVTLGPDQEVLLGTIGVAIPGDFVGSFELRLADTTIPLVAASLGVDATDNWNGDPNPPVAFIPAAPGTGQPSGFAATIFVTAVPEPSSFLLLGFVGIVLSGRKYWRR